MASSDGCGSSNSESNNVYSNILDLVSATICSVCAEGGAVTLASRAVLPADWAIARVSTIAWRIAEETAHFKAWSANKRSTSSTTVGILSA